MRISCSIIFLRIVNDLETRSEELGGSSGASAIASDHTRMSLQVIRHKPLARVPKAPLTPWIAAMVEVITFGDTSAALLFKHGCEDV